MSRRLALITGGTSGIGLGIARELLQNHDLALVYASRDENAHHVLASLHDQASQAGLMNARLHAIKCPVSDYASCQSLMQSVESIFGSGPSVFVHAGGRLSDGLFLGSDFSRHVQLLNEHLTAAMALSHLCLRKMYKERFGRLLFLSSISAVFAKRGQVNYATAKAGLDGFVRTLALEVAHRGITVNAIAPGLIESDMTSAMIASFESKGIKMADKVPAGYAGKPQDVGHLGAFLCSDAARYITGTTITIDGGRSLGDPLS